MQRAEVETAYFQIGRRSAVASVLLSWEVRIAWH